MQLPHVSAAQASGVTPMTPNALENLISRLKSPEWHVRHNAGAELLQIENLDPKFIDPLIELLATSTDDEVCLSSAYALGQSKDPKVLEPLLRALNDQSERVQEFVLMELWNFQDPKMVMPLTEFLLKTNESHFADYAVNALLPNVDERVVEPIIDCLKNRPESKAAIYGAKLLAKVYDPRAVEPLIEYVEKHMSKSIHAVEALGELADKKAVDVLITSLQFRDSPEIRRQSAISLGKLGDKKAVELLISILNSYNHEDGVDPLGYAVADALEKIGDERAKEPLKRFSAEMETLRKETAEWVYSPIPGQKPGDFAEYLKYLYSQ